MMIGRKLQSSPLVMRCFGKAFNSTMASLPNVLASKEENAFADFIAANASSLSSDNIANILYQVENARLQSEDKKSSLNLSHLSTFGKQLSECDGLLNSETVSKAVFGMQSFSSRKFAVRQFLNELTPKIEKASGVWSGEDICNVLVGLQNMHSSDPEVLAIVKLLPSKIASVTQSLSLEQCSDILFHCQQLVSSEEEVKSLIVEMTKQVGSMATFTPSQLGRAMYGMQNMSSDSPESIELLNGMHSKVKSSLDAGDAWTPEDFGNVMYGLQNMSSQVTEVQQVLATLANIITANETLKSASWSASVVGQCLFGLQQISNFNSDAAKLIAVMAPLVVNGMKESSLSAKEVSQAVFGIHRLRSSNEEEKSVAASIWNALIPQVSGVMTTLNKTQQGTVYPISDVCDLLGSLNISLSVIHGVEVVETHHTRLAAKYKDFDEDEQEAMQDAGATTSILSRDMYDKLHKSRLSLRKLVHTHKKYDTISSRCPTRIENAVVNDFAEIFGESPSRLKVQRLAYVEGFEMDAVIMGKAIKTRFNIEVDEPYSTRMSLSHLYRMQLRDAFLKSKEVMILRVKSDQYVARMGAKLDRMVYLRDVLLDAMEEKDAANGGGEEKDAAEV